ncbi:hypothetical protein BDW22DRAFT_376185 [Trametopsis cervina]|nr:hypothetical protein BDW22DRAFT_376185 [Trametopsis cervina]
MLQTLPTISFSPPYSQGISLETALNGPYPPKWRDTREVLTRTSAKIICRINWPGYYPFHAPMNVFDETSQRNPLSKDRLAKNIAKIVIKMLRVNERMSQNTNGKEQWVIRPGLPLSNVILADFRHVSSGSWQPGLFIVESDITRDA